MRWINCSATELLWTCFCISIRCKCVKSVLLNDLILKRNEYFFNILCYTKYFYIFYSFSPTRFKTFLFLIVTSYEQWIGFPKVCTKFISVQTFIKVNTLHTHAIIAYIVQNVKNKNNKNNIRTKNKTNVLKNVTKISLYHYSETTPNCRKFYGDLSLSFRLTCIRELQT